MEDILKQLMVELKEFRNEVNARFETTDKRFESMDKRFDETDKRFENMDMRFDETDKRFENIDKRFDEMDERFENIDKRFDETDKSFDKVEQRIDSTDKRMESMDTRFDGMDKRFDSLDKGQEELKELIKHNAILMTENFTDIRKDIRLKNQDTQADINLLFKEVEGIKRKVNKMEQRPHN